MEAKEERIIILILCYLILYYIIISPLYITLYYITTSCFALPSKDPRNFVSRSLYGALLKVMATYNHSFCLTYRSFYFIFVVLSIFCSVDPVNLNGVCVSCGVFYFNKRRF